MNDVLNISAYKFVPLHGTAALRATLLERAQALGLKGTVLLAEEGINLFLAGTADAVRSFVRQLASDARFADLHPKESWSATQPFGKLLVKVKREIIRMNHPAIRPASGRAPAVDSATVKRWLDQGHDDAGRPVVTLDTRNAFEVEMGTFEGAVDPKITRFGEFPEFAGKALDPAKHTKIAMFCTGGIRCEKASSYLLSQGFKEVYHLKGGILKYLEDIPEGQSLWHGECFVFDQRIALGHGLSERQVLSGDGADHTDATEIEMSEQAND